MPGFPELIAMIVILIVILGAKQMPQLGSRLDQWLARRKGPPPGPPTSE